MQIGKAAGRASEILVTARFVAKRLIDTALAAVLLVFLSPLLALTWLAIRIDSRGPAFFSQERIGARRTKRNGIVYWDRTVFRMYKFRSMFHDVDEESHRESVKDFVNGNAVENENGPKFKMATDPRVTSVGQFIRRTSIDELPQLFNVLRGEMSLVGPRPVPTYEIEDYSQWHFERFGALPGITGYWQVYGRGSVPFDEMMRMDIFYVRNQSWWLDLKLLTLTLPAVILGRGAS
jgi:lipopolysaccharide/colanic/teichoic acid biosynthesis glycosyltransferase